MKGGTPSRLRLSATDPGAGDAIESWRIEWDDGASSEVFGNNVTADHVYANDGIYDIVVTAVDDQDATELLYPQPAVQTTVSNIAPEISVTHLESGLTVVSTGGSRSPRTAQVNEASLISLRLVASDPGDEVITWTIDWADGSDISR